MTNWTEVVAEMMGEGVQPGCASNAQLDDCLQMSREVMEDPLAFATEKKLARRLAWLVLEMKRSAR
ncbi:hypothetical protein BH11MYX3_BH11MYX3_05130 [soil metagenome]